MVKICGITNRDDAMAAVDGGADALGFNFFERSPRYIAPDQAAGIAAAVPPGVLKVGVFVREPRAAEIARVAGMEIVQLHGGGEAPAGMRYWRAYHVDDAFDASALDPEAEACLLDAPFDGRYGGTGQMFDWRRAGAGGSRKIIVAGGLAAENVKAAIEQARPWGVDACSRLERAPGIKDRAKMAAFLKAATEETE